jgi:hypothetical protein
MLSCREVTRLIASENLWRAPLLRRLSVRAHLLMCAHCSRYARELRLIGAAVRDQFRLLRPAPEEMDRLESGVRERIRSEIKHQSRRKSSSSGL